MKKKVSPTTAPHSHHEVNLKGLQFPVFVERGVDGWYIIQCPLLDGCFTQGKTLDEALTNIKEVIELCLEEEFETAPEDFNVLYRWKELGLHTVTL